MGDNRKFLECEKLHVYQILSLVGGFLGAYTFTMKGGVFCNAQTGNIILMSLAFGRGNFEHGLYYIVPIIAYLFGTILSEALPNPLKRRYKIRWDTIFIFIEILVIIFIGVLPHSWPFQISQISINIIMAMQYNTFRQSMGVPVATTFCTNNIRQIGINFYKVLRKKGGNINYIKTHLAVVLSFVFGAIICTFLTRYFYDRTIIFTTIPLVIIFIRLLIADIKHEKDYMHLKPSGH